MHGRPGRGSDGGGAAPDPAGAQHLAVLGGQWQWDAWCGIWSTTAPRLQHDGSGTRGSDLGIWVLRKRGVANGVNCLWHQFRTYWSLAYLRMARLNCNYPSELLGFWNSSIVGNSKYKEIQRFGNWILFRPQLSGLKTPTLLGPSERASLDHWIWFRPQVRGWETPTLLGTLERASLDHWICFHPQLGDTYSVGFLTKS
jgi:hypothetical protein